MTILSASDRPIDPEPTCNDLCEHAHNDEMNTFPADHTAADEAWFAEATRDDDGPDDEEWDRLAGEAEAVAASEAGYRFF